MRVKKFRRISLYEIGKTESYLSDMAKEGLILKGMSQGRNIFEINEPVDIEYRIEFGERVLNREMRELYEMSGWSYVCSFKGIHIFQAEASDTLVEIHTDPEEQSYTLRKTIKMFVKLISFELILLLVMVALSAFIIMIGDTPVLNLLENNFNYLINIALVFYVVYEIIRQMHVLVRIKKRLHSGFYIDHHEPWKKHSVSRYIINSILVFLLVLCFASIASNIGVIVGYVTGWSNYALTLDTKIPVVRLNDIEKLELPEMRTYISEDSKHPLSNVRVNYNVFMKKLEINEEFIQRNMTFEGRAYTPLIQTKYYKIYVPFIAQGALTEVLYKAENYFIGLPDEKIETEKLNCSGLDDVYYIPSGMNAENYFGLVVRKGNVIMWMIYSGQKTRTEVIEAAQELLQ